MTPVLWFLAGWASASIGGLAVFLLREESRADALFLAACATFWPLSLIGFLLVLIGASLMALKEDAEQEQEEPEEVQGPIHPPF